MKRLMLCILAVVIFAMVAAPAQSQQSAVPGDRDGNTVVSDQELQLAVQEHKDGKISSDDLAEIRHVHDNYPRTIKDSANREVTIYKPIERIAVLTTEDYEVLRTLKASDKIVAASKYVTGSNETDLLYPEGRRYINVGDPFNTDYEALLKADPDIVISYVTNPKPGELEKNLKDTGITVIRMDSGNISQYLEDIRKMGYILEKEDQSNAFAAFYNQMLGTYLAEVKKLPDGDKPRVYLEADFGSGRPYFTVGATHSFDEMLKAAGGRNVYSNITYYKEVSPESTIMQNPEIILRYKYLKNIAGLGKKIDDTSGIEALRNEILSRPELKNVTAVQQKEVYAFTWDCTRGGARFFLGLGYLGKWLLPELFKDYNPREAYQEYLRNFQGLDLDVVNNGVFAYPEA